MSSYSSLSDRFATTTKRQSINPLEVFEEYDHRKTGFLPPATFIRALVSTNFYCTHADCRELCDAYEERGQVNYRRFLRDVANPSSTILPEKCGQTQPDLLEFGLKLRSENLTVMDVILEYDRIRVGRVSLDNFYRAFGSSALVKRVAQQYTDAISRDVDYMALNKDIQYALKNRSQTIAAPKSPLPEFFENFVRCVVSRNINLGDTFCEYDRYKRGFVSLHDFLFVLSSFGIPLSPEQLQQVALPFLENDSVNYRSFAATVDNMSTSFASAAPFCQAQEQVSDVDVVLAEIKSRVAARRTRLREQLETAAQECRGRLSRQRFYKLLSFEGFNFSLADLNALDSLFLLKDGTIDVASFVGRVDPYEPKYIPVDTDELIIRLKVHLARKQESISKYFASFDKEESGSVSLNQLVSALTSVNFHPTTNELNALAQRFGNGRFIQWRKLCDLIEPVIEKQLLQSGTFVRSQFVGPREAPGPEVVKIMRKIYQVSKRCGVDFRKDLVRMDVRKCGLLNARSFKDEINSLPIKISNIEFTIVTKPYFKPNTDMVCYPEFCEDLENYGSTVEEVVKEDPNIYWNELKVKNEQEAEKTNEALQMLKGALMCRRITPDEMFFDHDSKRTGLVPNDVVIPAFRPISIFLSDQQMNQIMKEFKDRRQPEKFNYRRLCSALAEVTPTESQLNLISELRKQITGENDGVQFITNEIKSKLAERKKNVYDLFINVYEDNISASLFRNRIEQAGIIIPEGEMQKLIRKYKGRIQNQINWQSFCSDVEESQPMQYVSYH